MIINIVNDQYESEVGIRHSISEVIVRTTSNDPYTNSEAGELLTQMQSFYAFGAGRNTLNGDLRFLFTGRNLDGNTVGIAFTGAVCSGRFGFGLGQHLTPLSNMTDLVAHELGHNWDQPHCNCRFHTMNASLTGANNFNDTLTVPNLIAYRNTRFCLDSIGPSGVGSNGESNNDDWINEIEIANLDFSVTGSNFNATTESEEQNLASVGSSVWWRLDPELNGTVTIDTFGSDFDTQLFVYELVPGGGLAGLNLVANNDDTNGVRQSQVTLDMNAGTSYEIRVGGYRSSDSISAGSEGNIVLNGTLIELSEPVLGDFNADGDVDGDDVDFYIGNLNQPATGDLAQLDLNADDQVTIDDHNLHVTTLVQTSNGFVGALLGDINLDGEVDVLGDGVTLLRNLGQSATSRSLGDLNANGFVNVLGDAFILIGQLGQSN